jgi:hypothetical protein
MGVWEYESVRTYFPGFVRVLCVILYKPFNY